MIILQKHIYIIGDNMNIFSDKKGFSLIELIVAMGMFGVVMLMATGIFNSVINGQRRAIASQNTQESMRYVFEVIFLMFLLDGFEMDFERF